jgi:TRAP-type C4-dicarboxylate transport system substrate-binding protein
MLKKSTILLLLITLFVGGFSQKAKYVIKFATLAPEGSTWMKVMRDLDKAIREATHGEVKFKIYPGGIAGDEKDVVRKIRFNQYHSAGFTGVGLGEILPEERIFDTPMLFLNYDEVDYITEKYTPVFEKKFEKKGFILLGWTEVGFVYVFSQSPIRTIDDLRKSKMWSWEGDPVAEATFNALGVQSVPLSVTDVLTSLQTNLINAVYTVPLACVSMQWYSRVKYVTNVKLANAMGAVLISKKMFRKLPPEYQKILKELGAKYMKKLVELSRKENKESLDLMLQNGIQMVEVDPASMPAFLQAAEKARHALVGKLYSKELMESIEADLKQFRNQQKK